ncbi:MAG: TRAP transporter small permease subunit [Alphaproteobacteria bacterium]
MLKNIIKILSVINNKIGLISSFFILILIFLVSLSVILRYIFSIGFIWHQDLYIWTHAIFILLGISYTLKKDGHVRIDLFYKDFKIKQKKIINLIGVIIFGIPITYLLLTNGLDYFIRSYNLNESSKESGGLPYIYILKFFIFFLGVLLFLEILRQISTFFEKND